MCLVKRFVYRTNLEFPGCCYSWYFILWSQINKYANSAKDPVDIELNNKIELLKAQFKDKEIQLIKDQNKIYVKILLTENVTKCFLLQD